jgi:hypothetical protein
MVSRRSLLTAAAAGTAVALGTPLAGRALTPRAAAAGLQTGSLPLSLRNESGHGTVYAYISGMDDGGRPGFVTGDGAFHPLPNPSSVMTPVDDYSIRLSGSGGGPTNLTLGHVIGGRIWFSMDAKLQFFVNPGPGLVQPGFVESDPNWRTNWTFCEFTYNSANLYANISYVDLVASPIAMATTGAAGNQSVSPLPPGALSAIASGLQAQHGRDGAPWDRLVATDGGTVLRVLSPTHTPVDFGDYWSGYLDRVWNHYTSNTLTVDTQSGGVYSGRVSGGAIRFDGLDDNGVPFTKPSARDIFGCASGPLYNSGADARGAVAARLGAALNRSALLRPGGDNQPNGVGPADYYQESTTNHYARLVHEHADVGYAFPYDDVGPSGSAPVDGHLQDPAPTSWTVTVHNGTA